MLKITGKTYTSIPALLFRLDQGRDILVEPKMISFSKSLLIVLLLNMCEGKSITLIKKLDNGYQLTSELYPQALLISTDTRVEL